MNWLFLGTVIFIFVMGVYGYSKGLLRMLYSVAALIISVLAMIIISPFLSSMLKSNKSVMELIQTPIENAIEKKVDDGLDIEDVLYEYYHLPDNISSKITNMVSEDVEIAKAGVTESIARAIAEYVCDLASYVIVFIAIRLILIVIGQLLHIVEKLPVIKTMNRLGGTTLALVEALGCIWIFFIIIEVIGTSEIGRQLIQMIWQNDFLRMLYENNIITYFVTKI